MSTSTGLSGEVVVVTGALGGVGGAASALLHDLGAVVVRTDLNASAVLDGSTGVYLPADLTDPAQVTELFARVCSDLGAPIALINCHGVFESRDYDRVDHDAFSRSISLNLTSTF